MKQKISETVYGKLGPGATFHFAVPFLKMLTLYMLWRFLSEFYAVFWGTEDAPKSQNILFIFG